MRDGQRRGRPCCPGFPSPFGAPAFASWASCARQGLGLRCAPAYRAAPGGAPDPDGVVTFRMRETATGVGTPSTPGPAVFTRPTKSVRPPLAVPPRPGPAPRCSIPSAGALGNEASAGVHSRSPRPVFPSPALPDGTGCASASSLSSAPRSYPRRTSGRGPALNTGQELRHRHRQPSNPTNSLATCDLVSHVFGPVDAAEHFHDLCLPRSCLSVLALSRAGHARSLMEGLKGTAIRLAVRDPSCPQGPGPGWSSTAPVKVRGPSCGWLRPRPPIPAQVPGFPVPGRRVAHDYRVAAGGTGAQVSSEGSSPPVYGADHPAPAAATAPGPAPLT